MFVASLYFAPALPAYTDLETKSLTLDCTSPSSYLKYCLSEEKCRKYDFLKSITDNHTVTCKVALYGNQENIKAIFESWDVVPPLSFTASTNLFHSDKEGLCTYFQINNVTIGDKQITDPTCPTLTHANTTVNCDDVSFMSYIDAPPMPYEELLTHYQFWMYLFCIIVAWCGLAVTVVMSDTVCFQLLGAAANKYGQQRLFGSLGWGTLVVIAGALIDYASEGDAQKDYTPAFVLTFSILFIDLFVATRLQIEGNEKQSGTAGAIARLICEPRIVLFVICCVVVGISTGILWTFQDSNEGPVEQESTPKCTDPQRWFCVSVH
ncbi:hypothetical protein SK128_027152 [Halocaridina rubra]|uniref:Major facilitator superfamily associated domain-containing protein n=1 Tax=Halocaridina rubra TaxID=373956 RepID=A0AAN8X2B1_HALRR